MSHLLSPEPSLTLNNLTSALEGLAEDGDWYYLAIDLNIPYSKVEHIRVQFQSIKHCKEEYLKEFLKSHPAPSWWVVAEALYQMGCLKDNPAYHTALERVVSMYPTGECVVISIHIIKVLYCHSTYSSQSGAVYIASHGQHLLKFLTVRRSVNVLNVSSCN